MLKAVKVSVLILLLACSVSAGEMPNDLTSPPPPPPSSVVQDEPTGGEIPNDVADSFMDTALTLLESVLALS